MKNARKWCTFSSKIMLVKSLKYEIALHKMHSKNQRGSCVMLHIFRILCTSWNAPSVTNEKKNASNVLKVLAFCSTSSYVITYAMQQTANHLLSLVVKMFQFNNLETNMQKNLQINFSKITAGCWRLKLLSLDFHITLSSSIQVMLY